MKVALSIVFFVFTTALAVGEALPDLPRELIERSLAGKITLEDVPKEWRTRVTEKQKGDKTTRTFFRGDRKILEVSWSDDQKEGDYRAKIYDGDHEVANFTHFQDFMALRPKNIKPGYEQITCIGDDGTITVGFKHENGFTEAIVIDGRNSNIGDDVDNLRGAIARAEFFPLIKKAAKDAKEQIEAK